MRTQLSFTPWVSWAVRNSLPDKDKPGVYLIGQFVQEPPSGPADPLEKNIVYIGESSSGRAQGRWRSFERAAFKGKGKHRGGKKYSEKFGGDSSLLYVSILPDIVLLKTFLGLDSCSLLDIHASEAKIIITDDILLEIDDLLIKYIERRLILLYSITHGNRPACNAD